MTRTIANRGRTYRLANEFQTDFEFRSIDAFAEALERMGNRIIGGGDGPTSDNPAFEVEEFEVYGTAGAQKFAWIKSTKTGDKMWFRNPHHAKGVRKLTEEHTTEQYELTGEVTA